MKSTIFLALFLLCLAPAQNPSQSRTLRQIDAAASVAVSLIRSFKNSKSTPATAPARTSTESSKVTTESTSQNTLTPVAQKLFTGVVPKLSNDDKNKIAAATKFTISKSEKNLFSFNSDDGAPFAVEVSVTDLNDDGIEEVIFQWGNTYWSGNAGTSCLLLIKNTKNNSYEQNLGFPGIAEVRETKTNGYRDLVIGGPGFEFPVYKWNGRAYEMKGTVRE